jgi:hypothetical protein
MAKRGAKGKPSGFWRRDRRGAVLAVTALAACTVAYSIIKLEHPTVNQAAMLSRLAGVQLEQRLRALVTEESGGLTVVVEALDADRAEVRDAAFRILHEELDGAGNATTNAAAATAAKLDSLAELLARHAPQFERDRLWYAAELAERLLAVSLDAPKKGSHRLRHCHVVLAAQANERLRQGIGIAGGNTLFEPARRDAVHTPMVMAPLAGGALPVAPSTSPPLRLPAQFVAEARPIPIALHTKTNPPNTVASTNQKDRTSIAATDAPSLVASTPSSSDGSVTVVSQIEAARQTTRAVPPAPQKTLEPAHAPPADLARLLDFEKRLRANDQAVAEEARKDLQRLQVDERQLSLARGAVDPDPRVRIEVVEALPLVASVEMRQWLLWFSHDRDPQVRRAAISLLATSDDPELQKRVRQAAASDSDPRVREQAQAAARGTR